MQTNILKCKDNKNENFLPNSCHQIFIEKLKQRHSTGNHFFLNLCLNSYLRKLSSLWNWTKLWNFWYEHLTFTCYLNALTNFTLRFKRRCHLVKYSKSRQDLIQTYVIYASYKTHFLGNYLTDFKEIWNLYSLYSHSYSPPKIYSR